LIENGIKYTEKGGSIHITLQEEYPTEKEKFVRIIVSDTGIGIAKEDQEKIFDRFFRVDKARSREQGGSGLGLSICKWIVEAHQGEIKVESEFGKGSSFIVKLPLSPPRMMN
jgi:signal transduction histidine kinase